MGKVALGGGNKLLKHANHAPSEAAAGMELGSALISGMAGATAIVASIPLIVTGSVTLGYGVHKFAKSFDISTKKAVIAGLATAALSLLVSLR
jgi:hypothetical protein